MTDDSAESNEYSQLSRAAGNDDSAGAHTTRSQLQRRGKGNAMSMLTGIEPAHWHDDSGDHLLYDPRERSWWNPRRAKPAELAYVRHLTAHELQGTRGRRVTDSPEVAELFNLIDNYRRRISALEAKIDTLRLHSA